MTLGIACSLATCVQWYTIKSRPSDKEGCAVCAEGTKWWKKARQKQAKGRVPLYNEFVDEEVSRV